MLNFNHITWQELFLFEPGKHINSLATIQNGGAATRHYKVIGAARFSGGDNRIYFDIFDLAGQRITPVKLDWNWENSSATPNPAIGDKPADQPSGNLDQIWGVHIWLEVQGDPSERITIPPPDGSSWYVCFQLVDVTEPQPEPTPDPLPTGQPPATPVNLVVESVTDATAALAWNVVDQLAERFKVSWSKNMVDWQHLTSQSMRVTVPNLLPDTTYVFRIQAVNQYGESGFIEIPGQTARTPDNPPPQPEPAPPPIELPRKIANMRIIVPPDERRVLNGISDVLTPAYIHAEEQAYALFVISLENLRKLVAYMESRNEEYIELGVELPYEVLINVR